LGCLLAVAISSSDGVGDAAGEADNPEGAGSPHRFDRAEWRDGVQRSDRRDDDRDAQALAQQGSGRVDLGNVPEHPWAEGEALEPQPVALVGDLGAGGARDMVAHPIRQPVLGHRDHLRN
jgi:hypothetical protein